MKIVIKMPESVLELLEAEHLRRLCTDGDCWCHDDSYWEQRLGKDY